MSTLVNQVGNILKDVTGTGKFVGDHGPIIVTPEIAQINDPTNNVGVVEFASQTVSSVNLIGFQSTNTGSPPTIFVTGAGADANVPLALIGNGTAGLWLQGCADGSNAQAGYIGELQSSVVVQTSPLSFTSGVIKDITSVTLTAGDWDVFGSFGGHATTALTQAAGWVNNTSATAPDVAYQTVIATVAASFLGFPVPVQRVNLTFTTTVYISCVLTGTGTITGYGTIYARRIR